MNIGFSMIIKGVKQLRDVRQGKTLKTSLLTLKQIEYVSSGKKVIY